MDAIDIIFIIVCIAVPMVGKYIDKAAKKSLPGHPAVPDVDEAEDSTADPAPPQRPYSAFPEDTVSMPVPEQKESPAVASEAAPADTAERIDKRKLVIYSEIMKPKFDEQADF